MHRPVRQVCHAGDVHVGIQVLWPAGSGLCQSLALALHALQQYSISQLPGTLALLAAWLPPSHPHSCDPEAGSCLREMNGT